MRMVRIETPGDLCLKDALFRLIGKNPQTRFLEVGVGTGALSNMLLEHGFTGEGLDFSPRSIEASGALLADFIKSGRYFLREGDFMAGAPHGGDFGLVLSFFVLEHIADDVEFLRRVRNMLRPGGSTVIAVPGRMDCWTVEDDTVGHLRRYDRKSLTDAAAAAGLVNATAWSVGVPVKNILFGLNRLLFRGSGQVREKVNLSADEQTRESGVRDIAYQTLFPSWFRLAMNPVTMWPVVFAQRFFFNSDLGLFMILKADRPD